MRKIVGAVFQSLDGVMQAPGGPTEDWTGGFTLGGWMFPVSDETVGDAIGSLFGKPFDLLLGRRTYDIFAAYWPYVEAGDPIGEPFDKAAKYVVTHRDEGLDWQNSHHVADIDAVAALKATDGPDLVIQGSSTLYPQLLAAGLIDRITVMTFPVLLGKGKRLFGAGTPSLSLQLVEQKVSGSGAFIATYEPAGEVKTGSFGEVPTNDREKARQERMKQEG
jgi:dihydrofolate reductase